MLVLIYYLLSATARTLGAVCFFPCVAFTHTLVVRSFFRLVVVIILVRLDHARGLSSGEIFFC